MLDIRLTLNLLTPIAVYRLTFVIAAQARYYTDVDVESTDSEEARKFLTGKTLQDGTPSSWLEEVSGKHIQMVTRSVNSGWILEQTWGFEEICDKRYHTRRTVVTKGNQMRKGRLVYDYLGPVV